MEIKEDRDYAGGVSCNNDVSRVLGGSRRNPRDCRVIRRVGKIASSTQPLH